MQKANSELYMRKCKIEKDCTNMARQLKAQKAKTNEERSKVVERMQIDLKGRQQSQCQMRLCFCKTI